MVSIGCQSATAHHNVLSVISRVPDIYERVAGEDGRLAGRSQQRCAHQDCKPNSCLSVREQRKDVLEYVAGVFHEMPFLVGSLKLGNLLVRLVRATDLCPQV